MGEKEVACSTEMGCGTEVSELDIPLSEATSEQLAEVSRLWLPKTGKGLSLYLSTELRAELSKRVYLVKFKGSRVVHAMRTDHVSTDDFFFDSLVGADMSIVCRRRKCEGPATISPERVPPEGATCKWCRKRLHLRGEEADGG